LAQSIFVVEDDPAVSSLLTEILARAGYEVTAADSAFGLAGLVRDIQPAAILLDLGLPFRPGVDLLNELKADARTAHVPVIVLSGLTEILSEERRALAAAVLAKPFDTERLLDVLEQTCAQSSRDPGAA
jgi:DNA-binding response OmpR family regulator